ncbi:MAG TPA: trypsin-like serine protease [Myxococcaceae bacterium]|nr:trypsin-like serine protease [Myxococcaceae bacterium]
MHPMMTRRGVMLRLLIATTFLGLCGGCAATGNSLKTTDIEADLQAVAAPLASGSGIELTVSNGAEAEPEQFPTTLLVMSDAAPGFAGGPGDAGECSGVLIAKNLVLTAAHCMCLQPMRSSFNKALNRVDCAKRVQVFWYARKIERLKNGDIETNSRLSLVWGSAFLPEEFRVDLDEKGKTTAINADVAVIRLDNELGIKLDHEPADRKFALDDRITVVGYGSSSVNGLRAALRPHFGQNSVAGARLVKYGKEKKDTVGDFHDLLQANTESGDSGGPCFREEGNRRWLMGIMLHKDRAKGITTSCLDLFHARSLVENLIKQATSRN